MKRIRLLILPTALALMLAFPQAANAQGGTAGGRLKFVCLQAAMQNPPGKDHKDRNHNGAHRVDEAAYRVYSMISGLPVDSLKKACINDNLSIWELAKRDGKLDALKARLITVKAASLDELVKGGVMTETERGRILAHIKEELDKK